MIESIARKPLAQLWYTWSTIGLDAAELPAGFRVRAASPELETLLYSQRMEQLDRYLRYSLPPGSDLLNTSPFPHTEKAAPICLAFIRTPDGERCLVHKVYTGKDGRGRDGAYFAHMLANLPTDFFSAKDAIRFWRLFPFWCTSDVSEQEQSISLPDLPLTLSNSTYILDMQHLSPQQKEAANVDALEHRFKGVAIDGSDAVDEHLRFLLSAYLLQLTAIEEQKKEIDRVKIDLQDAREKAAQRGLSRRELNERKAKVEEREGRLQLEIQRELPRIFIVAPPDEVAYLIAGLTRLLPRRLLQDLTFSTYESDVLKLPFHIVGTCEPSVRLDQNGSPHTILPLPCYHRGFVLNTYLKRDDKQYTNIPPIEITLEKVADIQDYADDMADALKQVLQMGTYSQRQGHEVPPDRLPPILDADESFTSEEIGDHPDIPLGNLPAITVDDLLMAHSNGQLSLPENTRILSDLYTALERLRRSRYRRQIFGRTYLTPNNAKENRRRNKETREEHLIWLQDTLPALLNMLRVACTAPRIEPDKGHELAELLDLLVELGTDEIHKATAIHQDLGRFLASFEALRSLEPSPLRQPEPISDLWAKLLERCCSDPASLRFIQQPEYERARQKLLIVALEVLLPADYPSMFLLNVPPTQFGGQKLLKFLYNNTQRERLAYLLNVRQSVPPQPRSDYVAANYEEKKTIWLHQATLCFFSTGHLVGNGMGTQWYNYTNSAEVIAALETDALLIDDLVARLLNWTRRQSPSVLYQQWYQTARMLYHTLEHSRYDRQHLKALWQHFWNDNDEPIEPDYQAFTLQQMEDFLTTYGPIRLSQEHGWRWVAPLFWWMAEQEKGAERNTRVLFVLLDINQGEMPISRENFDGLLNIAKVTRNFNAKDAHQLLTHYVQTYARDIRLRLMGLYADPLHDEHIQTLLLTHFNPKIHEQWMATSPLYSNRIYRLALRYAKDYPQELHDELLNSPYYAPYLEVLHDLFIQHSTEYENLVHKKLMQRYLDQYNGEAHQLFMNYVAESRENKEAVLKLFSAYSAAHTEKVHALLIRHAIRYHEQILKLLEDHHADLITREFSDYLQQDKWEVYLLQLHGLKEYEQIAHKLLATYTPQYVTTYQQLSVPSPIVNQHTRAVQRISPDYLQLYPDLPLWTELVKLLQAIKHAGKMPLVQAYIQTRYNFKGAERLDEGIKQALMFLKSAKLSTDEYHEVMYRSGPNMQDVKTLSPLILQYYRMKDSRKDFALLCRQLDKHPDDELLANELLEKTWLEESQIDDYLSRYGQNFPLFCYRLQAALAFYAKTGWHKIHPYLSIWLSKGMSDADLQGIGKYVPSGISDTSLLEEYAERYLGSGLFLQLIRQYLEHPDIKLLQRERGRKLVGLLARETLWRQKIADNFDNSTIREHLEILGTLLDFLSKPSIEQERLNLIFKRIYQKQWARSSITLVARALISCINYRIEPGYIYAIISQNKNELAEQCMEDMAQRAVIQCSVSHPSTNLTAWQHRLALLVEIRLLLDQKGLIEKLLNPMPSEESYRYLQNQSAFWSPKQQSRASSYGLVTALHEWPWTPISHSQPREPEPLQGEQEIVLPEEMPKAIGILETFFAWLRFPLLFFRLGKLCQQKQGTGKLVRFWLDNGNALIVGSGLTPYHWKRSLQFAAAFHNACLDMIFSPTLVTSQNLLAIVEAEAKEEESYLPNLTIYEGLQVQKAAKCVGLETADCSPHLTQLLYSIEQRNGVICE